MDIEYVRSRFIKHFDGTTGFQYMLHPVVSTSLVSTPIIMVVSYFRVL